MTGIVPAVLLAFAMSGADEKAIHQVFSWLVNTWNSHDMKAHCSVFAPDADFVNVNGWWWQGRKEIERQHTTAHETVFKTTVAEIAPKKIRLLKPDVAVVQASWRVTGDVRSKDPRDYIMTYVLRKHARKWLILAAQNSSAEDRSTSSHPSNVSLATPASFAASDQKRQGSISSEEGAIASTLGEINQAWSSGDVKAAVSFYQPDADLVSVRAEWFKGTADIERYLLSLRSGTNGARSRQSDVLKVTLLHPDTAVVTERWSLTSTPQGQAGGGSSGLGLLVMTKENGVWKTVASQNTITRTNPGRMTAK
jgi:uncharacterized protein (TIGR02246 family)